MQEPRQLPSIYGRWEQTKKWEHQRQILYAKMAKWAEKQRWEAYIETNLDISKSNIEDLVKLWPNPGTGVAIHQSAKKGCSILMVRPVSAAQVEERNRREEQARARAGSTRTEEEIYQELNIGPCAPAQRYFELRDNIITVTGVT